VITDEVQRAFDVRLKEAGPDARMRLHERLYRTAFATVFAQADRAGDMSEVERARFLLRRLYPDLEGPRLDGIIERLEAEWVAGTWTGVRRVNRTTLVSGDRPSPR
jgi:hypothetical protein